MPVLQWLIPVIDVTICNRCSCLPLTFTRGFRGRKKKFSTSIIFLGATLTRVKQCYLMHKFSLVFGTKCVNSLWRDLKFSRLLILDSFARTSKRAKVGREFIRRNETSLNHLETRRMLFSALCFYRRVVCVIKHLANCSGCGTMCSQ